MKDEDIKAQVVDYSQAYPQLQPGSLGEVNYKQLKSGSINVNGKKVRTGRSVEQNRKIVDLEILN